MEHVSDASVEDGQLARSRPTPNHDPARDMDMDMAKCVRAAKTANFLMVGGFRN